MHQIFAVKLGLNPTIGENLNKSQTSWEELEPLLREATTNLTIFWRLLHVASREFNSIDDDKNYDQMSNLLIGNHEVCPRTSPFYEISVPKVEKQFLEGIKSWRKALQEQSNGKGDVDADYDYEQAAEHMRLANPKNALDHYQCALVTKAELMLMLLLIIAA